MLRGERRVAPPCDRDCRSRWPPAGRAPPQADRRAYRPTIGPARCGRGPEPALLADAFGLFCVTPRPFCACCLLLSIEGGPTVDRLSDQRPDHARCEALLERFPFAWCPTAKSVARSCRGTEG